MIVEVVCLDNRTPELVKIDDDGVCLSVDVESDIQVCLERVWWASLLEKT